MTKYCAVIGPALYREVEQNWCKRSYQTPSLALLQNGVWPRM